MNITDNLKKDISNAPEWFLDAIVSESEVKVLEAELGNVSYKCSARVQMIKLLY